MGQSGEQGPDHHQGSDHDQNLALLHQGADACVLRADYLSGVGYQLIFVELFDLHCSID